MSDIWFTSYLVCYQLSSSSKGKIESWIRWVWWMLNDWGMMGPYSIKKGYIVEEKETSLGKKCTYDMFILSFKKTYKKYKEKNCN